MSFVPEFINLDDVLDLHEMQLRHYGGREGIRDLQLLESAVMTHNPSGSEGFNHLLQIALIECQSSG